MRSPEAQRRRMAACLQAALDARDVSQVDMAARLGITSNTLNNWVQAKTAAPAGWLALVADELGMSLPQLAAFGDLAEPVTTEPRSDERQRPDPIAERLASLAPAIENLA